MKTLITLSLISFASVTFSQSNSSVTVNQTNEKPSSAVIPNTNGGTEVLINQTKPSQSSNPGGVTMKHPVGHSNNPGANATMGKPEKTESKVINE